jgi:hypothetical protein
MHALSNVSDWYDASYACVHYLDMPIDVRWMLDVVELGVWSWPCTECNGVNHRQHMLALRCKQHETMIIAYFTVRWRDLRKNRQDCSGGRLRRREGQHDLALTVGVETWADWGMEGAAKERVVQGFNGSTLMEEVWCEKLVVRCRNGRKARRWRSLVGRWCKWSRWPGRAGHGRFVFMICHLQIDVEYKSKKVNKGKGERSPD